MKKANISYLKNNISRVVQCVREGESVTVMDRDRPVAVIRPIGAPDGPDAGATLDLVRRGAAALPREHLDPARISRLPWPEWGEGPALSDLVRAEREESP
jgi:antitoxin (DNA-binding transcriptional repressor) of toxin-antitoxin stability system